MGSLWDFPGTLPRERTLDSNLRYNSKNLLILFTKARMEENHG